MKKIIGLILTVLFFYSNFLFAQSPEMSDQYLMIESLMNPSLSPLTYTLGPGDNILLNLWGNINADYTITVARDGTIFIPRKSVSTTSQFPIAGVLAVPVTETVPALGEIKAVGLTVAELKEVIEERVKNYFRGVDVRVTLTGLRSFPISIVGSVARAGVYSITPLYRLSHVIKRGGGISETGSYRNIVIKKPDGSSHIYDLYEFFYKGNIEQNPYIKAGDIVMVPQAVMSVKITGRVLRTGNYE
ncbi:SLBB domain-containing protein, partial [candidate division WOR-3 bacterium]|nr:SLBB domain-containing protein [candidate division WOR-3 bacterium]